jgi:geranyl-CoA carboxylase alpha subunit
VFHDVTLRPPKIAEAGGDGRLVAPMDGKIIAVHVEPGQSVKKGQPVVVLEAMKMELQVLADVDGAVEAVQVAVGKQVSARQVLVQLTPAT